MKNLYIQNNDVNIYLRKYFAIPFIYPEDLEYTLKYLENEINSFDVKLQKPLREFYLYFTTNWIKGRNFNFNDIYQNQDLLNRSNNWSENFNGVLSKRFVKSSKNFNLLISKLYECSCKIPFELNDLLHHNYNYIAGENQMIQFTNELLIVIHQRNSTYKNKIGEYLSSLSSISLRLALKIERETLINNGKYNPERIEEIDSMLNGDKKIRDYWN